jgi:HK97 family phage prohead protease
MQGKTVLVRTADGKTVRGLVSAESSDGLLTVRLGIVDGKRLLVSAATVTARRGDATLLDLEPEDRRIEASPMLSRLPEEAAKGVAVRGADNQIIDYRDVRVLGYASTFQHITPSDRQGDAVLKGAFLEAIKVFRTNPVMLLDHRMSVGTIAGHWDVIREDENGLYVEGNISNAPELRHVRFLLMEKSLRTLSIGGVWMYAQDGRTIEKAHLFEISLVAVPANPDAIVQARALTADDLARLSF